MNMTLPTQRKVFWTAMAVFGLAACGAVVLRVDTMLELATRQKVTESDVTRLRDSLQTEGVRAIRDIRDSLVSQTTLVAFAAKVAVEADRRAMIARREALIAKSRAEKVKVALDSTRTQLAKKRRL